MISAKAACLSQRQRRLLVLTEYAGLSAFPLASLLAESAWWMMLALVGIVASVFIHDRLLARFTQNIANKVDAALDERQAAIRNDAHRTAYRVLGSVVVVALVVLQMLTTGPLSERPWAPQISTREIVAPVCTTILWIYITLPTAVIAWREPDPEPDE